MNIKIKSEKLIINTLKLIETLKTDDTLLTTDLNFVTSFFNNLIKNYPLGSFVYGNVDGIGNLIIDGNKRFGCLLYLIKDSSLFFNLQIQKFEFLETENIMTYHIPVNKILDTFYCLDYKQRLNNDVLFEVLQQISMIIYDYGFFTERLLIPKKDYVLVVQEIQKLTNYLTSVD